MNDVNEIHNQLAAEHDNWQEAVEVMNRLMSVGDDSDEPITNFMVLRLYQIAELAKSMKEYAEKK
jgi:uncharacterized protein YoaH (UPF0181 family)